MCDKEVLPMNVQMVRFKVKPSCVDQFEEAAKGVFAAARENRPKGVRNYVLCRLSDGHTYLALVELHDGLSNPLLEVPEGKKFLENVQNWVAEPPIRDQLTSIGSYQSL
jgi:hypothetical protein